MSLFSAGIPVAPGNPTASIAAGVRQITFTFTGAMSGRKCPAAELEHATRLHSVQLRATADLANPWSAEPGEPHTTYEYEVLRPGFELVFSAGFNPATITDKCLAKTCTSLVTAVPNGLAGRIWAYET